MRRQGSPAQTDVTASEDRGDNMSTFKRMQRQAIWFALPAGAYLAASGCDVASQVLNTVLLAFDIVSIWV
jgi:hypothetical protein